MIVLLLGPDDFSKKEYVRELAKKEKAALEFFGALSELPLNDLTASDLFSAKKFFALEDALSLLDEEALPQLLASKNHIFFLQEKIDKRGALAKKIMADKSVKKEEFTLPHGRELNEWLERRFLFYNAKASAEVVELLALKLGRDEAVETKFGGKIVDVKEQFSLWQADSEVKKLTAYASGRQVSANDVEVLVSQDMEADVLKVVNAIGEGRQEEALELVGVFLQQETAGDEKGKIIQLNALLSEQFRNVAAVQDFLFRKIPETEILEKTGWKSGRLFIIKKIARKFAQKKVLDLLNKLAALDVELKSTSTPPRVLLDLIMVQLF